MNQLQHIDEFKEVLGHYRLSEEAKTTLQGLPLVLMVGPTSSGRNTIIRELVKTGHYHFIVSDTTRKPRVNDGVLEQDGVEYWFRTEEDMLADLRQGMFLEAAVIHNQQVSGMSIRELAKAKETNKIAIDEVEIAGAGNTYIAKPDTIIIFSVPPNFDVWMQRLRNRGKLPEDEVRRRLESAADEFEAALTHDYYHFVVNDKIEETVASIEAMVHGNFDDKAEYQAREIVKDLRSKTNDYLLMQY